MVKLDPDICRRIKEARREAGLSQTLLAREVGCKQSALSMFEQGDGTKLSSETVKKLCAKFSLELPSSDETEAEIVVPPVSRIAAAEKGFCPNPACPSHERYKVEERIFLRPLREKQDPAGGKFCAICGEILERECPNCGAPLHDGAVCTFCGKPYIAVL